MVRKEIEIEVYGAEQICASCVNLPSSKDTCEWLEAALTRKFPEQPFKIYYIDMYNPPETIEAKELCREDDRGRFILSTGPHRR